MDNIIKYIQDNDWKKIKSIINNNIIDWNYLIDPINNLIHLLAYKSKNKIIP